MNRGFKGIWIERKLWFDRSLTMLEKVLYIEIQSLQGDDGKGCFASNAYFADFLGVKERQVQNILKSLKTKGLIKHVGNKGKFRLLQVIDIEEKQKEQTNTLHTIILYLLISSKDIVKVKDVLNLDINFEGRLKEINDTIKMYIDNNQDLDYFKIQSRLSFDLKNIFQEPIKEYIKEKKTLEEYIKDLNI